MKKEFLFTPGPTPVPDKIREALARPLVHHRSEEFSEIIKDLRPRLKKLFGTTQEVVILAASGTGGMEASLRSILKPDDQVLVVNAGKFGERFSKISSAFGLKVDEIKIPWGKSLSVSDLEKALKPHHSAILIQHSETSTGVVHPLPEIGQWLRQRHKDCLLIVDGITSIGAMPFEMDAWGIDAAITGSQKALMLPPGLAMVSLSARARTRMSHGGLPGFYFDLRRDYELILKNQTSFTPAINLVVALLESLKLLEAETWPAVFLRHHHLAEATRKAFQSMGLRLAAEHPGVACTSAYFPAGIDGKAALKAIKSRHGFHIAGAQDEWEGKVFRLSHLGYYSGFDLLSAVVALGREFERQGFAAKTFDAARALTESLDL